MRVIRLKSAFTLIELLAVISIIAILIALLLPTIGKSQERAKRAQCMSNLRQTGIAVLQYAADHKGAVPPRVTGTTEGNNNIESSNQIDKWGHLYTEGYLDTLEVFYCPSRRKGVLFSRDYEIDNFGVGVGGSGCGASYSIRSGTEASPLLLSTIARPASTSYALDIFYMIGGTPYGAPACHQDKYQNVLYYDGHVSPFIDRDDVLVNINGSGGGGAIITGFEYINTNQQYSL